MYKKSQIITIAVIFKNSLVLKSAQSVNGLNREKTDLEHCNSARISLQDRHIKIGEAKGENEFFFWSPSITPFRQKDVMEGDLALRPLWWDADELKELIIKKKLFKYKRDTLQFCS